MTRFTDEQLDEIERDVLTPHRQITMPTMRARQMLEEIRELRDQVSLLQLTVGGSRAVINAVEVAARYDRDTKLSAIQIERPNGPPFYLVDALHTLGDKP